MCGIFNIEWAIEADTHDWKLEVEWRFNLCIVRSNYSSARDEILFSTFITDLVRWCHSMPICVHAAAPSIEMIIKINKMSSGHWALAVRNGGDKEKCVSNAWEVESRPRHVSFPVLLITWNGNNNEMSMILIDFHVQVQVWATEATKTTRETNYISLAALIAVFLCSIVQYLFWKFTCWRWWRRWRKSHF